MADQERKEPVAAEGVVGWLLRGQDDQLYFRVYSADKSSYTDYDIAIYDVQVQIVDKAAMLYPAEGASVPRIDYRAINEERIRHLATGKRVKDG